MSAKFFKRAGIGFLIGIVVYSFFTWLGDAEGEARIGQALLQWTDRRPWSILLPALVSGLYGAIAMGGTVLYDIERWSLAMSSVTHCLLIAALYAPIALLFGWVNGPTELLLMEGVMMIVYFIIWLAIALRYKARVRRMNESLRRFTGQQRRAA